MHFFYQPHFNEIDAYLDQEESRHVAKVLRLTSGSKIDITNGQGTIFHCEIEHAHHKKTTLLLLNKKKESNFPTYRHLAIAPTKNMDRMEWLVEKSTEIGIDEISFVLCHHSERRVLKSDRLIKKAISALKQSSKSYLPKINELIKLDELLQNDTSDTKSIAYVDFNNPVAFSDQIVKGKSNLILVGPEGDFSMKEVTKAEEKGFSQVSLGPSRLRTETAGLISVHLLNLFGK